MRVRNIEIVESPMATGRVRLRAEVLCADRSIPPEVYWLDVPESHARHVSKSGNSWLVLLAPLAANLAEPLQLPLPVDRQLLANIHDLMRVWHIWYPKLSPVDIEADVEDDAPGAPGLVTASLFSGGIDAWFTLLSNNGPAPLPGARRIDELLCIWGFDVSLGRPEEFRAMRETLERATSEFGARLVDVASNLHETHWWRRADWGQVAHGCGLASIAHALGPRYSQLLVPSSHRYDDLAPWGSHPLTDPLLSSGALRVIHDGAGYGRVEKTAAVAKCDAALESLQVCWETKCFRNCGTCSKCYRTMATLYLLGALERCPRFGQTDFDPAKLSRVFSPRESERALMREIRDLALSKGRPDIARQIDRSFKTSGRVERAMRLAQVLATTPFLWRARDPLEHFLLSYTIH
jgi:hypothetical protein